MAIRNIRHEGEPCLRKECKIVKEMTPRTQMLIEDLFDTMYDADGVGLAAPQVGVLKRIAVVDVGEEYQNEPLVMINPIIVEKDGEQVDYEGCLSVPGKQGKVKRANYVKVECFDEELNPIVVEGEGLLARALQHEIEHLDGILYIDSVEGELEDCVVEETEEEE